MTQKTKLEIIGKYTPEHVGTPVTGGDAQVAGWCHPEQLADLHIDNSSPDRERFVVMSRVQVGSRDVPLVRQSDAQAAIAALEAEVGRKDTRIAELEEELSGFRAGLSELIAKEVADLKGQEV